jgi:deoxyribonuclease IV
VTRMGLHVSISGGLHKAVERAKDRGCDVFQIFSHSPRSWNSKNLSGEEARRFISSFGKSGLALAVDHMPYLPNLASPKDDVFQRSIDALSLELDRCHMLGIPYLVSHLGSHLGAGWEEGFKRIVKAIDQGLCRADNDAVLLLENTAGTKNSMGSSLEEIAAIIDAFDDLRPRLGVCLDTCHLFAKGYELRTQEGLQAMLNQFQDLIGLDRLMLLHINDCRGEKGSHLDRHEHIGLGQIGENGFRLILAHPALKDLPMILETPVDSRRTDMDNLRAARKLASGLE